MGNDCQMKRFFDNPVIAVRHLKSAEDLFRDEEHLSAFSERIVQYQAALINLLVEREATPDARVHRTGQRSRGVSEIDTDHRDGNNPNHEVAKIVLTMEDYKRALCEYRHVRKRLKLLLELCSC